MALCTGFRLEIVLLDMWGKVISVMRRLGSLLSAVQTARTTGNRSFVPTGPLDWAKKDVQLGHLPGLADGLRFFSPTYHRFHESDILRQKEISEMRYRWTKGCLHLFLSNCVSRIVITLIAFGLQLQYGKYCFPRADSMFFGDELDDIAGRNLCYRILPA